MKTYSVWLKVKIDVEAVSSELAKTEALDTILTVKEVDYATVMEVEENNG